MGWTPREVDDVSLWELNAAFDGWKRSQGGDEDGGSAPLSEEEHDALLAKYA